MGLKKVLLCLINLSYPWVSIGLDGKPVVDGMSGRARHRLEFSALLHACKTIMQYLPNFRVSFIMNRTNNIAHLLTGAAAMSDASCQFFRLYLIKYCDYFDECNELILWLINKIVCLILWSFKNNNQGDIWIVKGLVAPIWRGRLLF